MSDTHLRIAQIIFNLIDFFISYPSINVHSIRLQMDAHYNRKALHYIFDPLLCVCVFAFGEIWYSGFMIVWTINMERLVSFRFISFLFIWLFDLILWHQQPGSTIRINAVGRWWDKWSPNAMWCFCDLFKS